MATTSPSQTAHRVSYVLSGIVILFLLGDAAVNLFAPHILSDVQAEVGFPADLSRLLGAIILVCAVVYAVPRTAVIGAILITAFCGGAICTHLRVGELGTPPQFIAMALAVLAWAALAMRDRNLRAALGLVPSQ